MIWFWLVSIRFIECHLISIESYHRCRLRGCRFAQSISRIRWFDGLIWWLKTQSDASHVESDDKERDWMITTANLMPSNSYPTIKSLNLMQRAFDCMIRPHIWFNLYRLKNRENNPPIRFSLWLQSYFNLSMILVCDSWLERRFPHLPTIGRWFCPQTP